MAVREPFADFSPKKYKFRKLMFMQGWLFITCVNQGATANLRTWDNTKLKPVRIHRQRKAYVYISLYIYIPVKVLYTFNIQSQDVPRMDPVAILQGKLPSMNT